MDSLRRGYREIPPEIQNIIRWKEINLNIGVTQSTLQDIKVSEKAGGYCYNNSQNKSTSNRFLYWRTFNDILEISELSFNIDLKNNYVRVKFIDSPVLAVSIHETKKYVIILVTTVSSIHRIDLNHPEFGSKQNSDVSILVNFNFETLIQSKNHHLTGVTSGQNIPHTAASSYSESRDEAYYAIAYPNNLLLFEMTIGGFNKVVEFRTNPMIPKLWSDFTEAIRGKSSSDNDYVVSMVFDQFENQPVVYALYRDNQLRLWSIKTGQTLNSLKLTNSIDKRFPGTQTNSIRKCNNYLCAFLSFASCSEFQLIKTASDTASNYTMFQTSTIMAPHYDLIDFDITDTKIWGVWCNTEGSTHVSTCILNPDAEQLWVKSALEPSGKVLSIAEGDPEATYCAYIFQPGRFQIETLIKALTMFSRSNNFSDKYVPVHVLQAQVCKSIKAEVLNEIKSYDIPEDEHVEIYTKYWEKFYSCCEQYHLASNQPIGIIVMPVFDAACLVKKNVLSFLRPCDVLENDVSSSSCSLLAIPDNPRLSSDLDKLLGILAELDMQLPEEIKLKFDKTLFCQQLPNVMIEEMISSLTMSKEISREFITMLFQKTQSMEDLPAAILHLLNLVNLDQVTLDAEDVESEEDNINFSNDANYHNYPKLFGGSLGVHLLTQTVKQISIMRYTLCRNLLVFQQILINNDTLDCNPTEVIRSRCIPDTVIFLQATNVMVWSSEKTIEYLPKLSIEANTSVNFSTFQSTLKNSESLLQLFIRYKGLSLIYNKFYKINAHEYQRKWTQNLLGMSRLLEKIIWPVSGDFAFGEWLVETDPKVYIQNYVPILNGWCLWNSCARHLLLALAHIRVEEFQEAFEVFSEIADSNLKDTYLTKFALAAKDSSDMKNNEILVQYYLKIIRLFEKHAAHKYIVLVAQKAIASVEKTSDLAMFQSILFNSYMSLNQYSAAYHTLIHNSELSRRKDCLRQLVVSLFQVKRFDILLSFPYFGLEVDFQNIIETRARSTQIEDNYHYNFLYAFYCHNKNMRKAALCIYEQALRLSMESTSYTSLQARYDSLLACANALELIDKDYAWIAKPVFDDNNERMETESDDVSIYDNPKNNIVVIDLVDIRKELIQVEAMLTVSKSEMNLKSILQMGPTELVVVLCNEKYYLNAFKLAKAFNQKLNTIFESLTAACIHSNNDELLESWDWLNNNIVSDSSISKDNNHIAWNLLKKFLNEEGEDQVFYYRSITQQILANNAFIPQWLFDLYRLANPSELLYLYVLYGRLEEASELAIQYCWAFLGRGADKFGFKKNASSTRCFPFNTYDLLLNELNIFKEADKGYEQNFEQLNEILNYYVNNNMSINF